MNSKITLASLTQLLSERTGRSSRQCEEFLRAFFQQIVSAIESGEGVKIKGFGTFKLSNVEARKSVDVTTGAGNEIPAHKKIVFVPSKELASAVNAPFEMFETVVLDENVLEEELMEAEATGNEILADSIREQMIIEEERADEVKAEYPAAFEDNDSRDVREDSKEEDTTNKGAISDGVKSADGAMKSDDHAGDVNEGIGSEGKDAKNDSGASLSEETETVASTPLTEYSSADENPEDGPEESNVAPRSGRRVWITCILVGILAVVIGLGVLWMLNDDFANWGMRSLHMGRTQENAIVNSEENASGIIGATDNMETSASGVDGMVEDVPENPAQSVGESGDDVPTSPSDTPVYDTVSDTRYLSTIAKEHYGNFNLWPYIYKENEKILGHPNRIRPGTRVVIPDLSKYGVDPKNKEDIEKAKKMGMEIYARYK